MGPESSGWREPRNVAIIQTKMRLGDVDENLMSALSLIGDAARDGEVDLFVLPEVFPTGFPYDILPDLAGRYDEVIETLSGAARDAGAGILFTQVKEENGLFFNRLILIDDRGRTIGSYDKTHLFSRSGEDSFFTSGKETGTFGFMDMTIGPLICYEVRFPELSRRLVLEGADVLVYPAQWPLKRVFQWELLLRARAVENQCFVIGVNGFGPHGKTTMGGNSIIVEPWGEIIARVGEKEGYAGAVLDPEKVSRFRKGIPVLDERRPDLY